MERLTTTTGQALQGLSATCDEQKPRRALPRILRGPLGAKGVSRCQIPIHSRDHIVALFSRLVISFTRAAIENPRPTGLNPPGAARRSSNPFPTLRAAQTEDLCPKRALMSEKKVSLSDFGQRRTMLKPKSYRLAGISYDVYWRGGRRSVSKGCVYVTLGSPAIATAFPAFLPTACRCQTGMSDPGRGYPPCIYILYLYCYSKRGQNQGIFPAFEDKLRAKLLVPDKPYRSLL